MSVGKLCQEQLEPPFLPRPENPFPGGIFWAVHQPGALPSCSELEQGQPPQGQAEAGGWLRKTFAQTKQNNNFPSQMRKSGAVGCLARVTDTKKMP
jgi:hypothetical protein